jgi:hypothetical protein
MERRVSLQGKNTSEKLAHLERILGSMMGRLSRSIVGIIPPIPFMSYVMDPQEGSLANIMIPISGVIDKAYIRIGHYDAKSARIEVSILSEAHVHTIEFECNRPAHSFDAGWSIKAGDVIRARGEGVSDVHIAFALQPEMSRTTKEKHILEGFIALMEKEANDDISK